MGITMTLSVMAITAVMIFIFCAFVTVMINAVLEGATSMAGDALKGIVKLFTTK